MYTQFYRHFIFAVAAILVGTLTFTSGCSADHDPTDDDTHHTPPIDSRQSQPQTINWSLLDSGVTAVDPVGFDYPFAVDSQNVQSYADYFHVDARTAQHNLTVGMASNEALSKLLDQLDRHYISHQLRDGADMALVVTTSDAIAPSRYEYVLADEFAHGLVLPIEVVNSENSDTTTVKPKNHTITDH